MAMMHVMQRGLVKLKLSCCSGVGAGADRLMRRSLRYGALPIHLLPRKASVFDYSTA